MKLSYTGTALDRYTPEDKPPNVSKWRRRPDDDGPPWPMPLGPGGDDARSDAHLLPVISRATRSTRYIEGLSGLSGPEQPMTRPINATLRRRNRRCRSRRNSPGRVKMRSHSPTLPQSLSPECARLVKRRVGRSARQVPELLHQRREDCAGGNCVDADLSRTIFLCGCLGEAYHGMLARIVRGVVRES